MKAILPMDEAAKMTISEKEWLANEGFDLSRPLTKEKDFCRQEIVFKQEDKDAKKSSEKKAGGK